MPVDFDKIIFELLEVPERDDLTKAQIKERCQNGALAIRAMREVKEEAHERCDKMRNTLEQIAMPL